MLVIPHLILRKDDKILLTRRAPTQKIWANHWHCVTGKIEEGETPRQAIIREAQEEIGLQLSVVNLVTTLSVTEKHVFNPARKFYAVELFFLADLPADQTPVNVEPGKQDAMDWFAPASLPSPMVPGVEFGLQCFWKNLNYAEFRNG